MSPLAGVGSAAVRARAAAAWRFRFTVERDAEARFLALAARLDAMGEPEHLADLARRAAGDERRHAAHCAGIAAELGGPVPDADSPPPEEVAPADLTEEDRVTYELVAACCVAESVSVAVLTALLPEVGDPSLRAVLRELARDEVSHARLGWAHLALAAARGRTAFLGPLLPAMLRGSVDDELFEPGAPDAEDGTLLALGVLPRARKRRLFVDALEEVVLPGLAAAGVDTSPAREWLYQAETASRSA